MGFYCLKVGKGHSVIRFSPTFFSSVLMAQHDDDDDDE